jgi:hypothetical protein
MRDGALLCIGKVTGYCSLNGRSAEMDSRDSRFALNHVVLLVQWAQITAPLFVYGAPLFDRS